EDKDLGGSLDVSTYQSMRRLAEEAREHQEAFDLIICDEAHRALTKSVQEALADLGKHSVIIGVTATPKFSETKNADRHFHELIHEMSVDEAILGDILSGAKCVYVTTRFDVSSVPVEGCDYNPKALEKALDIAARNDFAVQLLSQPP